jgi:hypothetical protein
MSGRRLLRVLCLCTAFAWAPLSHGEEQSFGALLQQADALRSADARRFGEVLAQLDVRIGEATALQRQQLRYLHSYKLALGGDFATAIRELRQLFDEAGDVELKFRVGAFLVNNFAATREFAEGLGYLDRTLALLPQVRNQELRQQGLVGASVMYNQVGQHDLALHYAEQILAESHGRAHRLHGRVHAPGGAVQPRRRGREDDSQNSARASSAASCQGEVAGGRLHPRLPGAQPGRARGARRRRLTCCCASTWKRSRRPATRG